MNWRLISNDFMLYSVDEHFSRKLGWNLNQQKNNLLLQITNQYKYTHLYNKNAYKLLRFLNQELM
jgi:hypothetical protein